MKAASVSFQAAVVLAVLGMVRGPCYGHDDARPRPSYFAGTGLYVFIRAIFYHLHPVIDRSHAIGDPIAAVESVTALADMALFGWLVLRRESLARSSAAS